MVGSQPVDVANGLALVSYTGPITITEATATTDLVELAGNADTLKTSPVSTTTDPVTPVTFQAEIGAKRSDTYTTTVEAPDGLGRRARCDRPDHRPRRR